MDWDSKSLKAGHYVHLPTMVVPCSPAIQAADDELGHAFTIMVGGTRPMVSVLEVVDFLRRHFELSGDEFDVCHHYPEDFIVHFCHGVNREWVLQSRRNITWSPLIWNPWRHTTLGIYDKFRFKVIVALARVPLQTRNLKVAQMVLGPACTKLDFTELRDRPLIDNHEFFISTWCYHPRLIP